MTTKMRPLGSLISLDEAKTLVEQAIRPIDRIDRVPVGEANGRVLAEDLTAAADVPPFDRAAMDGYAVRAADTTGSTRAAPRTLAHAGTIFTGEAPGRPVGPGECLEIATGAPMPPGADAVVIVEETDGGGPAEAGHYVHAGPAEAGHSVQVFAAVAPGQNVGRRGADIARGRQVLTAGTLLTPSRVGVIAALGRGEVAVYARPRVAILSTGNELVDPGARLGPGQIYDINRFTLAAVAAGHGGVPVSYQAAADTLDDLSRAVDDCLHDDLLVFSGGSSVGERDLILDVLTARGELIFHGIALKPGKPTAFGRVGGKLFFGMPGYPTSCLSNAYLLLVPALRRMARLPPHVSRTVRLPLGRRVASAPGRHQIYTVKVVDGSAIPAFKASGDITSMSEADGYIEIAAETDVVDAGEIVEVILF